MKTKENKKGISLIVLVITIIVIIILATAVIVTILDNNPIASAIRAVDDSNIAKYTEQIEQIRSKLLLQNENHELPNLQQMKDALEKEKWVVETEMIMDEGIEKLKIVSKEGYIFYITEEDVEYKGKGEVADTSALKRDDVLELVAQEETTKGQYVKITSKAEEYYVIKYKIGEEENNWTEIKSGERVEVPYGKTIYAKLFYGSSSGVEFKLKIGESNPSIVAKNTDTSNMKRKTDIAFANLFDITWGSEGTGSIVYEVTGNMLFDNKEYTNIDIENTKDLELGIYNVKCTITSPSKYTQTAQKQVKITTLANTSVVDDSSNNVGANAIYSQYDLAYFRDLVNKNNYNINGKVMNEIDMKNVSEKNWLPIGYAKNQFLNIANGTLEYTSYYSGIFDGDNNNILNLKIEDTSSQITLGLFGTVKEGTVKNIVLKSGSIKGSCNVGSAVGYINYGKIENIRNEGVAISSVGYANYTGNTKAATTGNIGPYTYKASSTGGIVGCNKQSNIIGCENNVKVNAIYGGAGGIAGIDINDNSYKEIKDCINNNNVTTNIADNVSTGFWSVGCVGGIVGWSNYGTRFRNCKNYGDISSNTTYEVNGYEVAGIVGHMIGGEISDCVNEGNITGTNKIGGIVGSTWYAPVVSWNSTSIVGCINRGEITSNKYRYGSRWNYPLSYTGGIVGLSYNGISDCHNYGKVKADYDAVGGIVGYSGENKLNFVYEINNCTNNNTVETNTKIAGGIIGAGYYLKISGCNNISNITGKGYQIAGMAGFAVTSTFENCTNSGTCSGVQEIGGIAGWTNSLTAGENSYIKKCTNTGTLIDNGVQKANALYGGGAAIIE